MNKIITSLAILLFFSCSNAPEKIKESNENKDIEQLRTDYLNKKNWMSPEDMEILSKCFIPYEERAPMDETQRKNNAIECLKKANLSENRINNMLSSSGLTLNQCYQNSVQTEWYVDLRINNQILIQDSFYNGYGYNDVPTDSEWRNALIDYLPTLYDYGYTYFLNGNKLTITNLGCVSQNLQETVVLNVGINININCIS